MKAYILKRALWMVPTLLAAATFVFVIMNVLPGDVATVILGGEAAEPDPEQLASLRRQLGLDKPLYHQYLLWLWGLVRLDLGISLSTGEPVASEIMVRLPYTLTMVALAVLVSASLAVPIGILSALRQDTWIDYSLRVFAITGLSVPGFWIAILLVMFLILTFQWFPPLAYAPVYRDPLVALQQLVFPAVTLGYRQTSVAARMLRSTMLDVLREDYVRTARSKGLTERAVLCLHALKNASLPVVSVFGIEAIVLFSGAVIIEYIFNVPGVGRLVVDGLLKRDIPLVQGVVLTLVAFTMLINLLTDLCYAWLDPRVRYK